MGVEVVFVSNLKEVMQKIDETAKDRMLEAVNEVRNKTLETLSGPRHGRVYKVPDTNRIYTASAPGEPPAQATATLRGSIKGGVESEGSKIVGFVGTDQKYGPMLEFGTIHIKPRPWLRKSFELCEAKVKEIFTRIWF